MPVFAALLIAALLAIGARSVGARLLAGWAVAWLAYAGYEWLMYRRVLCSGECNIRVDLLLIYPVLVLGSLSSAGWLVWRALRGRRAARGGGRDAPG